MNKFIIWMNYHIGKYSRKIRNIFDRKRFIKLGGDTKCSIISQNCVATLMYHDLGLEYCSPTINLFMESRDYINFVENLKYYLSIDAEEIKFVKTDETFPVGYLENIKIYFTHYINEKDVIEKWNRRRKRINYKHLYIIMTDRDGCTEDIRNRFMKLKYRNKIFFTSKNIDNKNIIYMPCFKNDTQVGILTEYGNVLGKRCYEKNFDYIDWIVKGL